MSNRDSLGFGDLLPQDVVEIFAQEKHSKRGRKKRRNSLGRALGWLKGKKRKDLPNKGQLGLGPALDLALDGHPAGNQGGHKGGHKGGQKSGKQAHPQAVSKRDDDDDKTSAPPLLQENVFIEASRPKYLENLHTEALEGLKMMQQEETNNGVEYQDNESTVSTVMVQTDGEGGFMTDSTLADTSSIVSVRSSVSTRSSRSGLTRQASTFRPLNSGKKSEKTKTRRRHRKTVVGIPQHVQKELGLDRVGWTLTQRLDEEQHYNGETDSSPTTDGPRQVTESQRGACSGLQNMNVIQPLNKHQLEQLGATHAGHRDDLALLHRLGPDFSGEQRPRSLAVPWMTTANSLEHELPSPVMSMSPQAPYMSKIIPNAVLPPSIDVVEISRGRSRNSVRTVSKSSLLLSSPAPSRASSRAYSSRTTSSRASSRASNITSASQYNPYNMSDSSCWSNSESSETLVSDSSTISSSSTPRQKRSQDGDASAKEDKISVPSSVSKPLKYASNGQVVIKGDEVKKEGQFVRSLSVMKPKRAPPPPSRSYSLHNKMKRRSRDLAEVTFISGESSLPTISASGEEKGKTTTSKIIDSPGYNADTSSLDDSTGSVSFSSYRSQLQALKAEEAAKVEETVSKDASQEKQEPLQENKLSKIVSPSNGYSSQDGTSAQLSKQPHSSSPRQKSGILAKLQRFFPGSTNAASPPPPRTQSEVPENTGTKDDLKLDSAVDTASVSPSVRTLRDLFNIPPPPKVHAPPPPPPEVWAHSKRSFELLLGPPAPDNIYAIIKKNPKDRRQQRHSPSASTDSSVNSLVVERTHKNPTVTLESLNGALHVLATKKVQESGVLNAENNDRLTEQNVDLKGKSKDTEKVEKVRVSDILNGMLVKAVEKHEVRLAAVREEEAKKTSTGATEVKTNMDTLPAISLVRVPPSPSPPLVHRPPQPPTMQTASIPSVHIVVSPESSWPPPPPLTGLGGPDEIEFPLPPPPMFGEEGIVIPVQVPPERSECVRVTTEAEPQKPSTSRIVPPPLSIPPPPPYMAPPPPVEAVCPPMTKKVSPLPSIIEVSPPPPKKVSPPPPKEVSPPPPPIEVSLPPPIEVSPPPPPIEVSLPPPTKVSPPLPKEASPPPPKEVSPVSPKELSHTVVQEPPPTLVKDVSPTLVMEVSTLSAEKVSPPSTQNNAHLSYDEAIPVGKLTPPQSIPPPPPLPSQPQLSKQEMGLPQESIPSESETPNTDGPATQEASTSPPSEVPISPVVENSPSPEKMTPSPPGNIPLPPPLPALGLASIRHQPSPASTENQTPELTSAPVVQKEPTPIITPSLLQMVKLRSVNSSPEPPKDQEQPETEVTMRNKQPSNKVPTSAISGEAPQKPIRRSLIMTSEPAIVTSQQALPKSQSLVVPPTSSSTVISPTKKSPPAMTTTSPSMNLQEAIRLRTAARSKAGPASRLSMQSPTSPKDLCNSPSSTASFIFSKSNKKVVTETKPATETMATVQNNLEASSGINVVSEAELMKKGVKVPPPVAKKPKTAGQESLQESIKDAAEKTNGTAGTVEGEGTPST